MFHLKYYFKSFSLLISGLFCADYPLVKTCIYLTKLNNSCANAIVVNGLIISLLISCISPLGRRQTSPALSS